MRYILFLLISVALHGAILSYPLALRPRAEEPVAVIVVMAREASEPGGKAVGGGEGAKGMPGPAEARSRIRGTAIEQSKKLDDERGAGGAKQLRWAGAEQAQTQARKQRLSTPVPGTGEGEPEREAHDPQAASAISASPIDASGDIAVPSAVADQAKAGAIFPNQDADHKSLQASITSSQVGDDPVEIHGLDFGSSDEFSTGFDIPGGRTANYRTAPQVGGRDGGGFRRGGGVGTGSGFGTGSGEDSGQLQFVQVSYAHAPRPQYPEQARREGMEGQVLVRVLVDEQGRSRSTEVNQSSGSAVLDMAAIEAIKRWRFSPARRGDRPVESWVKIPIEFRLSDANQ